MTVPTTKSPVFVFCASRSGSTLLRYILDSHPNFSCPPELGLVILAERLYAIYSLTLIEDPPFFPNAKHNVIEKKIENTINSIMSEHLSLRNKDIWCEKSVQSIDGADLIARVFPNARFICLYRNCLDQVQSGLDVLRNDPTGRGFPYGFHPFLLPETKSRVDGLVDYWCAKSSTILRFETANPERCFRIRYEDMVSNSDYWLRQLFTFLGDTWERGMKSTIFSSSRQMGPGDHKILQTSEFRTASIGSGNAINTRNISRERLEKTNDILEPLGYAAILRQ